MIKNIYDNLKALIVYCSGTCTLFDKTAFKKAFKDELAYN